MKTSRKLTKPPRRKNRGHWTLPACCPGCAKKGTLSERQVVVAQVIKGEEIDCEVAKYVCDDCGAAFMSPEQATAAVKCGVIAFQNKHRLLTATKIREGRKKRGLTTAELAEEANVGEATIKRLEAGSTVQQQSTNKLLQIYLTEGSELPDYEPIFDSTDIGVGPSHCEVPAAWIADSHWNGNKPWENPFAEVFCMAADSNELALSA